MIAVDTSIMVAYFHAEPLGLRLNRFLAAGEVVFPPPVLTEVFSGPALEQESIQVVQAIPLLGIAEGYWVRAGIMRAALIAAGNKARLGDALIAQSCIDHDVPLLTLDRDYRHFTAFGLRLAA